VALVVGTNSYISQDDADTYFSDRLYSDDWSLSNVRDKPKALITAFNILETSFTWFGTKTDEDQVQEFPRDDETTIPTNIISAQCEIALLIISNGEDLSRPADMVRLDKVWVQSSNSSLFNDTIINLIGEYGSEKTENKVTSINVTR
jgi:hypothetical protein